MLYYKLKNNNKKETIVVIHGLGGNCGCFAKQYKLLNKYFNVLFVDLHSHGKSKECKLSQKTDISFKAISDDIINILNDNDIQQAYFLGLSLGTIVVHSIVMYYEERVKSIIQVGTVFKYSFLSCLCMTIANFIKEFLPRDFLYKMTAYAIMPRKRHKESRNFFIKAALTCLDKKELSVWFKTIIDFSKMFKVDKLKNSKISKLYIIGEEDYVFLRNVIDYTQKDLNSKYIIIKNAGHICNMDNSLEVNNQLENYFKAIGI